LTDCAGSSDDDAEDAWYVVAEYATDQRSGMDTVEIVEDVRNKAEQFMHQAGSYMQSGHIGKANDLCLFEPIEMSKVSCAYMCQHDLLCHCGAGIRITETKRKLFLEFKGTHDKNSHRLRIMHAGSSAPDVGGIKSYMSDNSDSDDSDSDDSGFSDNPKLPNSDNSLKKSDSDTGGSITKTLPDFSNIELLESETAAISIVQGPVYQITYKSSDPMHDFSSLAKVEQGVLKFPKVQSGLEIDIQMPSLK
jgi:hypothetical protein